MRQVTRRKSHGEAVRRPSQKLAARVPQDAARAARASRLAAPLGDSRRADARRAPHAPSLPTELAREREPTRGGAARTRAITPYPAWPRGIAAARRFRASPADSHRAPPTLGIAPPSLGGDSRRPGTGYRFRLWQSRRLSQGELGGDTRRSDGLPVAAALGGGGACANTPHPARCRRASHLSKGSRHWQGLCPEKALAGISIHPLWYFT